MARNKYKNKSGFQAKIITVLIVIIVFLVGIILYTNRNEESISSFIASAKNSVSSFFKEKLPSFNSRFDDDEIAPVPSKGVMNVHVIDVGQGSATLIETEDHAVLIDAGDQGKGVIIADYLYNRGITTLDLVIATHPHSDHIGGMDEVLNQIDVKEIIMPTLPVSLTPTSMAYSDLLNMIEKKNKKITPAVVGDVFEFGDLKITIMSPSSVYEDLNNMSVISKIEHGVHSVMVTGDAYHEAEKKLVSNKKIDLSADILIAGHHGSRTSSAHSFVRAVDPKYAAASMGIDNDYGHPHEQIINLFAEFEIPFYRTNTDGTIVFICDGENITVESENE